jgi:hypothetical protein
VFARLFSARVAESVLQLWASRSALLDALAELPQTFCHLDAFRRNIIPSRSESGDLQSVLLDWAFAGTGALGEELAPLTIASVVFDPAATSDALPELDDVAFRGYLDGLADVGWKGKRDDVRFVYATAAALRYLVGVTGLVLSDTDDRGHLVAGEGWADPTNQIALEALLGRSFDDIVDHLGGVFAWVASLADEAFRLKP